VSFSLKSRDTLVAMVVAAAWALSPGAGIVVWDLALSSANAAPPKARKGDAGTRDGVGGSSVGNGTVPATSGSLSIANNSSFSGTDATATPGKSAAMPPATAAISHTAMMVHPGCSFEKEVVGTSQRFLRPVPGMGRLLEREINSERFQDILFQSLGLKLSAPGTQPHRFVVSLEQAPGSPLAYRLSMKTKRYTDLQMDNIFRLAMNYLQRRLEGHSLEFSLASTTALGDSSPARRDCMTTALLRQYPWVPDSWLRVVEEDGRGEMVQYALLDGSFGWRFTVFKSQGRFVVEADMHDALEMNNAYQKLFQEARASAKTNLIRQGIDTASKNWAAFFAVELKTVLRVKYNLDWKSPADIAALYVNGD
jgi:hypothetical protein